MSSTDHLPVSTGIDRLATLSAEADDLESLVRPLLDILAELTGLEATVLTIHDRRDDTQVWRFVHSTEDVPVPEGMAFPWEETLCQALIDRGERTVADLATDFPDHPAHTLLGIRGFVSQPYTLVGRAGQIAGTLCAGSRDPLDLDDRGLALFELFSRLVADQLAREIELGRERLRADRAEERLAERTRLVASAEHALKSPLTVAQGWSRILASRYDELDDAARKEAARRINEANERLWSQVEDLLAESRTTVLGFDLQPGDLDLAIHLAGIVRDGGQAAPDHHFVFDRRPVMARVDPRALEHLVLPLLENAATYAPAGTTVRVEVERVGDVARISVSDEGPGLPDGIDLFEPFTRGAGPEHPQGTGLGLHIVRTLAQASRGRARAESSPGGGARFVVELPGA